MKLLIDLGNSRLKWAELRQGELTGYGSCAHREVSDWTNLFARHERPETVFVASVAAEEVLEQLAQQVTGVWGVPVVQLHSARRCCGVSNSYTDYERLGVDRWAAMLAAYHRTHAALCVIDCGSAVTLDALDSEGRHLGGYIVPGWRLQQQALLHGAARIDEPMGVALGGEWGRNTLECVTHGIAQQLAALVERSVKQLEQQLQRPVSVVMTGGDAGVIMPLLDMALEYEQHLVLQGLALMVEQGGD